ncbi:MAG: co-chaperone GroES [Clostridia bacterium]|nr:co-chaperone GroES [Clostridia bacterium]
MNIKPLYDYLVVDAKEKQETTKGGLILTAASAEKYVTAKVLAVGNGGNLYGKEITLSVKVGDEVLYPVDAVSKVKVNGEEISLIRQSDVLAVID